MTTVTSGGVLRKTRRFVGHLSSAEVMASPYLGLRPDLGLPLSPCRPVGPGWVFHHPIADQPVLAA